MKYKYNKKVLEIAKFMDITPIKGFNEYTKKVYYYYNNYELEDYEGLPFYNTWEELMPVVIKIETLGGAENELNIFGNYVQVGNKLFTAETKLEAVRKAVDYWISKYYVK